MRPLPVSVSRSLASLFLGGAVVAALFVCAGCEKKTPPAATTVESAGGPVAITADDKGFKPSSVKIKKGAPATLVFTRTSDDTCATEVVFPQLDIKKDLPKGQPVSIAVPTDKEQTLTFQCGMGMYKSSVVVAAN
jgi:plastocyanin domain-containing protein